MNMWVIGPGESCLVYRNEMERLQERETFAFHNSFPHCVNYLGITPTYWSWFDPGASINGLKYLVDEGRHLSGIKINLPGPMSFVNSRWDFLRHAGNNWATQSDSHWSFYRNTLETLKDKHEITEFPAVTTYYLFNNREEIGWESREQIQSLIENPEKRFVHDKMILGSCLIDDGPRCDPSVDKYDWDGSENKISMSIMPMLQQMGVRNVFIVGFDGFGARFYNRYDDNGPSKQTMKYMQRWNEWTSITGMKIYSVVEDKYTYLNKYVDYIPFEHALEIDS